MMSGRPNMVLAAALAVALSGGNVYRIEAPRDPGKPSDPPRPPVRFRSSRTPHQGKAEIERRRRQMERDAKKAAGRK